MSFMSTNPATGLPIQSYEKWNEEQTYQTIDAVAKTTPTWRTTDFTQRSHLMFQLAKEIRQQKEKLAKLVTEEMGKLYKESLAEVEKCALGCEYYAEHAESFLADQVIESDASRSLVCYQPLGTVLAIMPWNFPLWQVMRFAAPAMMAGNTALLKHASNVPGCALALERLFLDAGFPENVFRTLMIPSSMVKGVIEHPNVHAVTLTGSTPAGQQVAATAGGCIKKSVLELGGSDAFVVLEDADLELTIQQGVASRFMNAGQSCIAAKRFIVVDAIADEFLSRFKTAVEALQPGNPMDESTTLAPMARTDLRNELHGQVESSIKAGAMALTGCKPLPGDGAFYTPSILDQVEPGNPAYVEELFGPVAIVIRARDEQHAIQIANDTEFGLGGSIWTQDVTRGERLARQLECGSAFVNGMVKSDPRLPFGGVKTSGFGRELAMQGIHEFVNIKTLWIR